MLMFCCVLIEGESVEPEACQTGSKRAATVTKRRHHRTSYDPGKDAAHLHTENGFQHGSLQRDAILRRHSAVNEDLYCPMNGVRVDSGHRLLAQNTPANLYRACSDETLSLHSHSRRLQQTQRNNAVKPTPARGDRISALDVAASATRRSHARRDRHRSNPAAAAAAAAPTSSGRTRRTVVTNNRPDLLCTWKDHDDWNSISPQGCDIVDFSVRPRHSSPQDDLQGQHTGPATNEPVTGTLPATTQSPQSIVSDGSPGSLYPIAPAASPVTLNSVVFSPPPYTLVSSSTTAVSSTTASFPPRPSVLDSRSNPDSGYGSKIYRCQGTGLVADSLASCPERVQRPAVETGANTQSRVCSSFPDVVVDRPVHYSSDVVHAATLPHAVPSEHQQDLGSPPTNLDLMAYSETNLVVSPHRAGRRQSRVPIELADDNSVVEGSEALSPLSLDSVNSVADKMSEFCMSSPTHDNGDVSVSSVLAEALSYPDVPLTTAYISNPSDSAARELSHYGVTVMSETENQILRERSLSSIAEDAGQLNGERESYREAGGYNWSPLWSVHSTDHGVGTVDSPQMEDDLMDHQLVNEVRLTRLQIGRCTTV